MQVDWQGYYLDGKTAVRKATTISLTATGLKVISEDGQTLWWPYGKIQQTQGFYPDEQIRLENESETIIIPDSQFLTALHQLFPDKASHFYNPDHQKTRTHRIILAALTSVGIAVGLYLWGIPALAAMVASQVPVSWEVALGRSVLEGFAPTEKRCIGPQQTEVIDGIMKQLLRPPVAHSPYVFQIVVIDSYLVNAFALPGGTIVIFRGLLEETKRPEQLAGVLAHEIQHISKRHTTRAILQRASTGLLLSAVTGNASGIGANGIEGARILGLLSYSRQHEEEADEGGIQMLAQARIDPQGMIEFFETIKQKEKDGDGHSLGKYFSTHPATENRIERLKASVKAMPQSSPILFSDYDWSDIRKICDATAS